MTGKLPALKANRKCKFSLLLVHKVAEGDALVEIQLPFEPHTLTNEATDLPVTRIFHRFNFESVLPP